MFEKFSFNWGILAFHLNSATTSLTKVSGYQINTLGLAWLKKIYQMNLSLAINHCKEII